MRRIFWILVPALALVGINWLIPRAANWHYVVSGSAGDLLYVAAFDGFLEDWEQYGGRLSAQVTDGKMRLSVETPQSGPYSVAKQRFADVDLRVQTQAVAGPLNNGFGVIFRLQNKGNNAPADDSYYLFLISSDGYYKVARVLDGDDKELSAWIDTPLIAQGLGAINNLRVVAAGNQFQFYINGELVPLCIPDSADAVSTYSAGQCFGGTMQETLVDDSISDGQIGVAATALDEPGVVVDFDNVIVIAPEQVTDG